MHLKWQEEEVILMAASTLCELRGNDAKSKARGGVRRWRFKSMKKIKMRKKGQMGQLVEKHRKMMSPACKFWTNGFSGAFH